MSDFSSSALVARLRAAGCVFAEDEARLLAEAAVSPDDLAALVDRRAAGVPLEHLLGWVEFAGRRFAVDPGVFVPRRRTELLVRAALDLLGGAADQGGRRPVVVDLCCGCGAVGASIAARVPGVELHAVDIDPIAVRCARRNLAEVGGVAHQGDLYAPLPAALRGRVAVLVANAPYVPTDAIGLMPPEAREHEPRTALDGGADGLDVVRGVVGPARRWLAPGGSLLVEAGKRQVADAMAAFAGGGLIPRVRRSDELGALAVIGTRK